MDLDILKAAGYGVPTSRHYREQIIPNSNYDPDNYVIVGPSAEQFQDPNGIHGLEWLNGSGKWYPTARGPSPSSWVVHRRKKNLLDRLSDKKIGPASSYGPSPDILKIPFDFDKYDLISVRDQVVETAKGDEFMDARGVWHLTGSGPNREEGWHFYRRPRTQRTLTVILKDAGENKIKAIKEIRHFTNLGLAESKKIADEPGSIITTTTSEDRAREIARALEKIGATVKIEGLPEPDSKLSSTEPPVPVAGDDSKVILEVPTNSKPRSGFFKFAATTGLLALAYKSTAIRQALPQPKQPKKLARPGKEIVK